MIYLDFEPVKLPVEQGLTLMMIGLTLMMIGLTLMTMETAVTELLLAVLRRSP